MINSQKIERLQFILSVHSIKLFIFGLQEERLRRLQFRLGAVFDPNRDDHRVRVPKYPLRFLKTSKILFSTIATFPHNVQPRSMWYEG
jgi:hypothetical protein